jgi:hypothetical protein
MAIQQTVIPHTHIVKLLYKMLPTNALANKFDGGTRKCPLCGSPNEDCRHILCCHHDSRLKWRNDFMIGLRDLHLQSNTSPLQGILILLRRFPPVVLLIDRRESCTSVSSLPPNTPTSYRTTESQRLRPNVPRAIRCPLVSASAALPRASASRRRPTQGKSCVAKSGGCELRSVPEKNLPD